MSTPFQIGHFKGHLTTNNFWANDYGSNREPFIYLGVNPLEYIHDLLGYTPVDGGFPYLRSREDLIKVCTQLRLDIIRKQYDSPREFKVGDEVIITRSTKSWNSEMDELVGHKVKINNITYQSDTDCRITFDGGSCWTWSYLWGHFKRAPHRNFNSISPDAQDRDLKTENSEVIPVLISVPLIN